MTGTSAPPISAGSGRVDHGSRLLEWTERTGLIILFVAMILWFVLDPRTHDIFTSALNLRGLTANQAVLGLITLAMLPALVCNRFDLSVAANAGIANVAVASLVSTFGFPIWASVGIGLGVGILIGAVSGFLVAGLRLPAFVATFGVFILLQGVDRFWTKGLQITSGVPESIGSWGSSTWLWIPNPIWVLAAVALILWYVLTFTPFGRYLVSIGSNEAAARLVGIRVERTVFIAYVLGGAIAGLAGVVLTARSGGAVPGSGAGYLFPAFAAVFLGTTVIKPGYYNVWGSVIGVFFVAVAVNGFVLLGASDWIQSLFNGLALIAAVTISTYSKRAREAREARLVSRTTGPPETAANAETEAPMKSAIKSH